jgi:predicted XRE-type DNA-binding protein
MNEVWKPYPKNPLYLVSDAGRVRGPRNKILKPVLNQFNRPRVSVVVDGKKKHLQVCRMVLETFYGPCPPGMQTCHGNDDPLDNRLSNLRWDTRFGNAQDRLRIRGGHYGAGSQKLEDTDVTQIRFWLALGYTQRRIAKAFGVSQRCVSAIHVGDSWAWLK